MNFSKKWTDTLLICRDSGVYLNKIIVNACITDEPSGLSYVNYHLDTDIFCYGLFEGFFGVKVADFCSQSIVAELLAKLRKGTNPTLIVTFLRDVFAIAHNDFTISLEHELGNVSDNDLIAYSTGTIVLIFNKYLYLANTGDLSQVILYEKQDNFENIRQLTSIVERNVQDPILKLNNIKVNKFLGHYQLTKQLKTNNRNYFEPEIRIFEPIQNSWQFFLILSSQFFNILINKFQNLSVNEINTLIIQETLNQLSQDNNLNIIARKITEKLLSVHELESNANIFLLIRILNYPITICDSENNTTLLSTVSTTTESDFESEIKINNQQDERIDAYVDFSDFEICQNIAREMGIQFLWDQPEYYQKKI